MTGGNNEGVELGEPHVRESSGRSFEKSGERTFEVQPTEPRSNPPQPLMDRLLDSLPPTVHFSVLASCVFIFFGTHNYLQEAISRMEGFEGLGSMLGYLEVVGVMVCSFFERRFVGEKTRKVSVMDYMQVFKPPRTFSLSYLRFFFLIIMIFLSSLLHASWVQVTSRQWA
jgi:hypothetical protein